MTVDSGTQRFAESADTLTGRRVLVLVNDTDLCDFVCLRLAFRGAEVRPARSVEDAFESYKAFAPDVVVAEPVHRATTLAFGFEACLGKPVYAVALGDLMSLLAEAGEN
jgi:hypothetical protein